MLFYLLFQVSSFAVAGLPALPSSVLTLPNDAAYWKNSAFQEMVAPLRLPTDETETDVIRVWLKLPDSGKITAQKIPGGPPGGYTLVYPPGTIADRVEITEGKKGEVYDVRGARIDERGNTIFHVYRKAPSVDPRFLAGYEWQRTNEQADATAGDALVKLLLPAASERVQKSFLRHNQCSACHELNAPAPATIDEPFHYESDSRGFFQPLSTLLQEITVRNHRPRDLNANDPNISVSCGSTPVRAQTNGGRRWYSCANRQAPLGRLDVTKALGERDPHAQALCGSRLYLFQHMDTAAREAFSAAFRECGVGDR